MILQAWALALDRIRANVLRSSLTMLGVIIGVAAVVALVSIGSAVEDNINDQFAGLGAETLTVQPGGTSFADGIGESEGPLGGPGNPNLAVVQSDAVLTADDLLTIELVPSVEAVAPIVQQSKTMAHGASEVTSTIVATTSGLDEIEGWDIAAGSFLPEIADKGSLDVVVLGATLAEDLGFDAASAVGATITIDGQSYGVVGVLEQVGTSFVAADTSAIIPISGAEGSLIDRGPDFNQIRVLAAFDPRVTATAVTDALLDARGEDDFSVIESSALISTASDISGTLTMLTTIIGGVSLVVGAIGIANMMLVAVRERSREIGIRRAVGASRSDITWQFLVESVVLSALGGVIGILLGAVLAAVLSTALLGVATVVSQTAVLGALAVAVLVGIAAGLGPAWQAASVDPTVALRYE